VVFQVGFCYTELGTRYEKVNRDLIENETEFAIIFLNFPPTKLL
jgi:hypothetical protein